MALMGDLHSLIGEAVILAKHGEAASLLGDATRHGPRPQRRDRRPGACGEAAITRKRVRALDASCH